MKYILRFCTVLFSSITVAQTQKQVWIKVLDAKAEIPLQRATVQLDIGHVLFTNEAGVLPYNGSLPINITISYVGYATQSILVKKIKIDTITIRLLPLAQPLSEVAIIPQKPNYAIYSSPQSELLDFEVWSSYILVGIHYFFQRKCVMIVMDSLNRVVDEYPLPIDFEYFYKSCINKYYAVANSGIYEVQFKRGVLFLKSINPFFFYDKILFYKGYYKNYFYIMHPTFNNQLHTYYIENTDKRQSLPFLWIANKTQLKKYLKDDENMKRKKVDELYVLDRMLGRIERQPSYNYEDDPPDYYAKETKGSFAMNSTIYFKYLSKSVKSQLFVRDSAIYIFDFENHCLNQMNYDGTFLNRFSIDFSKQTGWKNTLQKHGEGYITSYKNENGMTLLDFLDWKAVSSN